MAALDERLLVLDWQSAEDRQRRRFDLWSGWPFLSLVVVLLGGEWFLRRRHGLCEDLNRFPPGKPVPDASVPGRGRVAQVCLRLIFSLAAATVAAAELVINEFLPDPFGSDGGREFVELLNSGTRTVDLGGWRLQFANGAEGAVWQTRWTGQAGQMLAPGERFLIVDRNWVDPVPGDAEVALACRTDRMPSD